MSSDDDAIEAAVLRAMSEADARGEVLALEPWLIRFPREETLLRRLFAEFVERRSEGTPGFIGPYRLLETLGMGGQGEVILAVDTRLDRRVALKRLRGSGASSPDTLERFRREARLASKLDHPSICPVYDVGLFQGEPYLVMRHLEGITLAQELARREPGPPRAESMRGDVRLIETVARTLQVAHDAGVIHRDLKPSNIMITPGNEPVLMDFGIARDLTEGASLTATGDLMGTPAYLAPEFLTSQHARADAQTDVYALGVTLYRCLTGRLPHDAPTTERLLAAIAAGTIVDPRVANPRLSKDLAIIVATAMASERRQRYGSPLEVAEDLARQREGRPVLARSPGVWNRLSSFTRRHPARVSAIVAGLLICGVAGYLLASWPEVRERLEIEASARRRVSVEMKLASGFPYVMRPSTVARAREALNQAMELDRDSIEAFAGLLLADLTEKDLEGARRRIEARPDLAGHEALAPLRRRITQADSLPVTERTAEDANPSPSAAEPAAATAGRSALSWFIEAVPYVDAGIGGDITQGRQGLQALRRCVMSAEVPRLLYYVELARAAFACRDRETLFTAVDVLESRYGELPLANESVLQALHEIDPVRAIEAGRRQLASHGGDALAWRCIGQAQIQARVLGTPMTVEGGDELASLERSRALDEGASDTWFLIGRAQDLRGRVAEAKAAYLHAVELDPSAFRPLHNLAVMANAADEPVEGLGFAERMIVVAPRSGPAWQLYAVCLARNDQFERALEAIHTALKYDPDNPMSWNTLGYVQGVTGHTGEAIQALREAVRLQPDYQLAWITLARRQLSLGDLEATGHSLDTADGLGPNPQSPPLRGRLEESLRLDRSLHSVAAGDIPESSDELEQLGRWAVFRKRPALAAWLLHQAWERAPSEHSLGPLALAASSAALEASDPERTPDLDPEARKRWRTTAVTGLERMLAAAEDLSIPHLERFLNSLTADPVLGAALKATVTPPPNWVEKAKALQRSLEE